MSIILLFAFSLEVSPPISILNTKFQDFQTTPIKIDGQLISDKLEVYNTSLDLVNCILSDIYSDNGGAIELQSVTATINGTQFDHCVADFGSAILGVYSFLDIDNTNFSSNDADIQGGAINLHGGILNISNCAFTLNEADEGGAIFVDDVEFEIIGSGFADNKGLLQISTISFDESNGTISTSVFINNTCETEGGTVIYIAKSKPITIKIISSIFETIESYDIYIHKATKGVVVEKSVFSNLHPQAIKGSCDDNQNLFNQTVNHSSFFFETVTDSTIQKRIPISEVFNVQFISISFAFCLLIATVGGFLFFK